MLLIPMAACGAERIAALLDRISYGEDRRTGLPSDRNRDIPSSYAKSPAAGRPAASPGTPSDPLPYSTGGQPNGRFDSLNLARTGDQMSTGEARVLRKGKSGGERNE